MFGVFGMPEKKTVKITYLEKTVIYKDLQYMNALRQFISQNFENLPADYNLLANDGRPIKTDFDIHQLAPQENLQLFVQPAYGFQNNFQQPFQNQNPPFMPPPQFQQNYPYPNQGYFYPPPPPPPREERPQNPLGDIFSMFGQFTQNGGNQPRQENQREERPQNPLGDLFSMFGQFMQNGENQPRQENQGNNRGNFQNCMGNRFKSMGRNRGERMQNIVKEEIENRIPDICEIIAKKYNLEEKKVENQEEKEIVLEKEQNQEFKEEKVKNPEFKAEKENKPIHHGYVCDGCEMNPIVGVCYKSAVLEDFDFCEKCEATKPHPYPFLKLKHPKQRPISIVIGVNEDLYNEDVQEEISQSIILNAFNAEKEGQKKDEKLEKEVKPVEKVETPVEKDEKVEEKVVKVEEKVEKVEEKVEKVEEKEKELILKSDSENDVVIVEEKENNDSENDVVIVEEKENNGASNMVEKVENQVIEAVQKVENEKKFDEKILAKAKQVADILGGEPEVYYYLFDKNQDVNSVVAQILDGNQ